MASEQHNERDCIASAVATPASAKAQNTTASTRAAVSNRDTQFIKHADRCSNREQSDRNT